MATISNAGARSIFYQNGNISYGNWLTSNQIQVGYYASTNVRYVIQLRFRLDKPCDSITIKATEASGSGNIYWKVSDKEADDGLITRMVTVGNEPDATQAGSWETFEIKGRFPADTDLYVYGYAFSTWHNVITLFGLYDSTRYTKVIGAEEMQGFLHLDTGAEIKPFCIFIDNGTELKQYRVMIDTGTEIKPYGS